MNASQGDVPYFVRHDSLYLQDYLPCVSFVLHEGTNVATPDPASVNGQGCFRFLGSGSLLVKGAAPIRCSFIRDPGCPPLWEDLVSSLLDFASFFNNLDQNQTLNLVLERQFAPLSFDT